MKEDPKNEIALKTKIASLIYNDQYEDALKLFKDRPEYTFESAYCHMQLGDLKRALDILSKVPPKDPSTLHLLAQIVL